MAYVKGATHSDEPKDNYYPFLQFPSVFKNHSGPKHYLPSTKLKTGTFSD